ncbi:DeoR/GlpR family DNA-binding transcription regulator [Halalkalibacter sp. APA_J-10(15)]|uniref:DeoR/GlpR family DNA-binding transcription regulator n=1 Tax=unclassified Halalkalibacter TaxID=2893063 RepID=UPI001FF6A8FF|nr:DeoR/GlpR family DNA-binding transcription regulator [Halalkalibacter sp. APA_J-10(15)]MCK0473073.1 DeoR/GlpR family DNA-binding transcription regulator [Halalkalibacter sp. APA_J-10(15)]
MLVAERHEKITALVNERGSIRVTELSQLFNVTEETIRRDLERLENEGKLRRSHGGAISMKTNQIEAPYFEREIRNVKEKTNVAKAALEYVNEHDRIILDASTTAWYMAKLLPNMALTVVTNSLKVTMELAQHDKVTVISLGGTLLPRSLSFVGPVSTDSLEHYHVNKAFLSCQGIHHDRGISDSNELQAIVKKKMMEISDETFLLADYSKFGVQAFARIGSLESVQMIITDHNTSDDQLTRFKDLPLSIIKS